MLLETCKPLQQDGQLRAGRAAARGEAAVAHAGQEPGLQRPADGRFRVGGDLRGVGVLRQVGLASKDADAAVFLPVRAA